MKRILALMLASFTAISSVGCSTPRPSESLSTTGLYFDTVITIEAWGATREILDHCEEMCESYEQLFSPTIETSEISQINRSGGRPV